MAGHDHLRIAGLLGLEGRQAGDLAQRDDEAEAERAAQEHAQERPRQSPGRFSAADHPTSSRCLLVRRESRPASGSRPVMARGSRSPAARVGRRLVLLDAPPAVASQALELSCGQNVDEGPHRRVPEAAELGADHVVGRRPCPGSRRPCCRCRSRSGPAGTRSRLIRHSGTQKECRTSTDVRCSSSCLVDRRVRASSEFTTWPFGCG